MSALSPGDVIGGRYRLIRVMGAGAMGVVWSARNEATDRDFAIKLMLPEAAKDPQRLQRFFKEAKLAGRLRHRCIVEVYDLGRIEEGPRAGSPYLVMELLEGEPLDALLRRTGKLPAGTALRVIGEVARGLAVAHARGVVHRDLKPANVFLHRSLEGFTVPKILDFGISKLMVPDGFDAQETTVGTILGSPAYMSPEQTAAEDLDPRADVWSLGVVLYKAISGELPFVAANFTALMLAINTWEPRPLEERVPGLPRELYALVHQCLSRRRGDRYANGGALADAIDAVLAAHELPVLDLSHVLGGAAALPSEQLKTQSPAAGGTLPFGVTTPTGQEATREAIDRTVREDGAQIVDAPAADATGALAPSTAVATPERARRVPIAVAAALALFAVAFVALRTRTAAPTAPAPAAAKVAEVVSAAPAPAMASAPASASIAPVATITPVAPKTEPSTKSAKKPAVVPNLQPKPAAGPHEGLVNPGF